MLLTYRMQTGDIDYVRSYFRACDDRLTGLLKLAKTCDRWRLGELPDLPQHVSECGRLVMLGDSAHAMYPDAAQVSCNLYSEACPD